MADLNPFSKVLQKHAGRAKERILQNLGKADRTTDEDFDLHVKNFTKQQNAVNRLQKEFKNYYTCLKAMQAARRSLLETVCELYEPCWDGVEQFLYKSEASNSHFEEFCCKVNLQVVTPVGNYLNQFPELSNKISKRNRKLLDYDNCRHNLQNLETMKKREEGKITKAKEQLEEAKNNFEVLNTELHDELPSLYDSRVSFFASNLQTLFLSEANFHNHDAAVFIEIGDILNKLNEAYKRGEFVDTKLRSESSSNGAASKLERGKDSDVDVIATIDDEKKNEGKEESGSTCESLVFSTPPTTAERNMSSDVLTDMAALEEEEEEFVNAKSKISLCDDKVLYQVRGTYKYVAEDGDELSFNVGDVIDVVSYDDPEEQEEGWLMGVYDGKKGLFPANFTTRI